jgi:hypothetical protein
MTLGRQRVNMSEESETKLEKVYTASGQLEAHIIKGKLESEGIPALLQYESEIFGLTVDGMGQVRILVPEPLAEKAREVIARDEE